MLQSGSHHAKVQLDNCPRKEAAIVEALFRWKISEMNHLQNKTSINFTMTTNKMLFRWTGSMNQKRAICLVSETRKGRKGCHNLIAVEKMIEGHHLDPQGLDFR